MLDEIGLFDEDFFAYYEDVDLAWRAQQAGWRCVYAPDAVVYHVHSATGKQGSRFKSYMLARNRIWTWCKDYPLPQLLLYAPIILLYDLMSLCAAVMGGQGRSAIEGRLAALSGLPRILDRRRHALRRVPSGTLMRHLQPVESPLAMLRRHRSG